MRRTVAVYERLLGEAAGFDRSGLLAAGAQVGSRLEPRWPELVRELEGIAAGAGRPPELLLAANARTELLGGVPAAECSLAAVDGDGGWTVAQTWDWHPEVAWVVWTVRQRAGRWFSTLTEAGLLAKIGISSAGLCCGLNFLRNSRDGGLGGAPVHVLLRLVLDRCDSVEDACSLLTGVPVTASSCVTVASRGGAVAVELSPGGARLVRPDRRGRLVHTNHFLADGVPGCDLEAAEAPGTLLRHARLSAGLDDGVPLERLLGSHADAPDAVCRHERAADAWPDRRRTLAAVVMEPGVPRMRVAAGLPCGSPFEEVA